MLKPPKTWNPLYDRINPHNHKNQSDRMKAENIRDCKINVADELNFDVSLVIPVYTKDFSDAYHLDMLLAAIQVCLLDAKKILLRRLLRNTKSKENWENLIKSFKGSSKFVAKMAGKTALGA